MDVVLIHWYTIKYNYNNLMFNKHIFFLCELDLMW